MGAKNEADDTASLFSFAMTRANATRHSHPISRKQLCKDLGLEEDFGGCVKLVETVGCVGTPASAVVSRSQDDVDALSTTWCALWQETKYNEAGALDSEGLGKQQRVGAHAKGVSEAAVQEEEVQDEEKEEEEEAEAEEEEEEEAEEESEETPKENAMEDDKNDVDEKEK